MQEPVQKKLAEFISGFDLDKTDAKYKTDAILRILDWTGCAIAGARYPQVLKAKEYLLPVSANGKSTVLGEPAPYPSRVAAFINGIAGHVCELDDGHRTAIGHPGSVTVPVAFALAEEAHATGREVLRAVIIGYDIFARLGRTVNPTHYKTWHTTGTCGTMAAAATAAAILKLTPEQTNSALGIAATMAGGLIESFGTHAKALNIAEACQNGIDAARMAKLGMTGSESALLGKKGFVAATCTDPHVENLMNPSEETLVSDTAFFKVYASCGHTNSPLDAMFRLIRAGKIDPERVESVRVRTYKVSVDVAGAFKASTEDEAKFSIPYCFAVAMLYGRVTLAEFRPEILKNERVIALASKVTVEESPEATARFPHREAEVTVRYTDGTEVAEKVLDSSDDTDETVVKEKFLAAASSCLDAQRSEEVMERILAIESEASLEPLFASLARL